MSTDSSKHTCRLTMLGTGSALVTRCYNTCFTLHTPEAMLLVDAGGGNGILAQLEKAGIKLGGKCDTPDTCCLKEPAIKE